MGNQLYEERLARIRKAVALEPVDKVPVAPCITGYHGMHVNADMGRYCADMEYNCGLSLDTYAEYGGLDATQAMMMSPYNLANVWMSDIAVPGVDLPSNESWQVREKAVLTQDDYDVVLKNGFGAFYADYLQNRLSRNYFEAQQPFMQYLPTAIRRFTEAGIPNINGMIIGTPLELFCGGRTFENFFMDDVYEIPDKLDKVFEAAMEYFIPFNTGLIQQMHPVGMWIGGWRAAPELMSPAMFERFVWPYYSRFVKLLLDNNVIPVLHLDSNWDLAIEKFKEFPKGSCIMALDGKTDMRRARKILGDHMCLLGDVPPEMMAFSTPQEVYDYTTNMIDDIGPRGYIVGCGCDMPPDAKKENVDAMVQAARDYKV